MTIEIPYRERSLQVGADEVGPQHHLDALYQVVQHSIQTVKRRGSEVHYVASVPTMKRLFACAACTSRRSPRPNARCKLATKPQMSLDPLAESHASLYTPLYAVASCNLLPAVRSSPLARLNNTGG